MDVGLVSLAASVAFVCALFGARAQLLRGSREGVANGGTLLVVALLLGFVSACLFLSEL